MNNTGMSLHEQIGKVTYEAWLLVFTKPGGEKWEDLGQGVKARWCFVAGVCAGYATLSGEEDV